MKPGRIRPIALAILRQDHRLLVLEAEDPVKHQTFYRLVGGGIEFGEYGHQAVVREIREELGAEIKGVRYAGMIENIFTYAGGLGHELALLYDAEFIEPRYYQAEELEAREEDGTPFRVLWQPLAFFEEGHGPLYPDGVLEFLRKRDAA